ncbi:MAG: DEAD/DEAH box helicase [Thermaerobacter sp.]|nr:DEAD/DEAH box helicase [Thermaerobacter sp.]
MSAPAYPEPWLAANGWRVAHAQDVAPRPGELLDGAGLDLTQAARRLCATVPGLYRHQHAALAAFREGRHVCLTTGTASGKTLAFQVAAADVLSRSLESRVAVLYPLKALGRQQEELWHQALRCTAHPLEAVRIDGGVPVSQRLRLLRRGRLVVLTPDILHAWLLARVEEQAVRRFLAGLRLVILDEAHVYSGVFGSNAAFLFRRLRHAVALSGGGELGWFAASATLADQAEHLRRLCGVECAVIGPEQDSSPRQAMRLLLIQPPPREDINTALGKLVRELARTKTRFLAFADSRRQVETLAVIASRNEASEAEGRSEPGSPAVLPYRSGYEEQDREHIELGLRDGSLCGVISTSALELGLDIGHLDVGIQVGVPRSGGVLRQRMGRIGRHRPGVFLVVAGADAYDQLVLRDPQLLLGRPLPRSTVYLDNRRIQYIHAMGLAGSEAEAERLAGEGWESPSSELDTWPEGFRELCVQERRGAVPPDLQGLKSDAADDPWHAFPLRDVGTSFRVEERSPGSPERRGLGSITYEQLLREAYPGAVYYYMAQPYRVEQLLMSRRTVVVSPERYYTTRPLMVPAQVYPNLGLPLLEGRRHGELAVLEAHLQVTEAVRGWEERRGNNLVRTQYPCRQWSRASLRRTFFTTGVCLLHPGLEDLPPWAGAALLEAFLLEVAGERGEVASGTGRIREGGELSDRRFVALYDQTYGSLRLTARLLDPQVLPRCLATAAQLLRQGPQSQEEGEAEAAAEEFERAAAILERLALDAGKPGEPFRADLFAAGETAAAEAQEERVILPGQTGILLHGVGEEFEVEAVFHHPRDGLMYRGHRVGEAPSEVVTSFPVGRVGPISGVTRMGTYDYETGQVVEGET